MAGKQERSESALDWLKWLCVILLLAAGVYANYYFVQQPLPLRIVGWIVLVCLALFIALQTAKGKKTSKFFKDSREEIRKVVWPSRQTTFQTTLVVIFVVVIFAVVMWGIDVFLMWAITWLTGARG